MMKNRRREQIWWRFLSSTRTNIDTLQFFRFVEFRCTDHRSFLPIIDIVEFQRDKKKKFGIYSRGNRTDLVRCSRIQEQMERRSKAKWLSFFSDFLQMVVDLFNSIETDGLSMVKKMFPPIETIDLFIIFIHFVEGTFSDDVNSTEMLELDSVKRLFFFDVSSFSLTLFERSKNEPFFSC